MSSGFKGRFTALLDSKQRVAVPAKLRRSTPSASADTFVITLGLDNCLFMYTQEQWDIVIERIKEVASTGDNAKYFTRMISSYAEDVELDSQSRIRVPQPLIERIQLEKEVLFIGALTRIELWRPDQYDTYIRDFDKSYEDVAKEFLL